MTRNEATEYAARKAHQTLEGMAVLKSLEPTEQGSINYLTCPMELVSEMTQSGWEVVEVLGGPEGQL